MEYVTHLQNQVTRTNRAIDTLRRKPSLDEDERLTLTDYEEKIQIYTSLLNPLKRTVLLRTNQVYLPKSYGILSRWPWYDFFRDWICKFLQNVDRQRLGLSVKYAPERMIRNLIYEIPTPPPGKLEVAVSVEDMVLYLHRPPVNAIPTIKNVRAISDSSQSDFASFRFCHSFFVCLTETLSFCSSARFKKGRSHSSLST